MLIDAVDQHLRKHAKVNLGIFVDDIASDSSADDKHEVVEQLALAAEDLAHAIEHGTGLPISKKKTAVLANSRDTARLLRKELEGLGGPCLGTVRSLGVDFWAANPKRARSRPVAANRR